MTHHEHVNRISEIVIKMLEDSPRADKGNKAAARRIRQGSMELRKACRALRDFSLEAVKNG
jgi:hypothetical protein